MVMEISLYKRPQGKWGAVLMLEIADGKGRLYRQSDRVRQPHTIDDLLNVDMDCPHLEVALADREVAEVILLLDALRLPLLPDEAVGTGGCDYILAVRNGQNVFQASWWNILPRPWVGLQPVLDALIKLAKRLPSAIDPNASSAGTEKPA